MGKKSIFEPAVRASDDFRLGDNRNSSVLWLRTSSHFIACCGVISYRNTRVNATVGFHLSRLWHNSRISPCGPFKETGRPPRQPLGKLEMAMSHVDKSPRNKNKNKNKKLN